MAASAKTFGRRIFGNQLLSNTIVGGLIYAAGEATAQNYKNLSNPEVLNRFDTSRIAEIGMLGSLENGLFMTAWYVCDYSWPSPFPELIQFDLLLSGMEY